MGKEERKRKRPCECFVDTFRWRKFLVLLFVTQMSTCELELRIHAFKVLVKLSLFLLNYSHTGFLFFHTFTGIQALLLGSFH